MLASKKRWKSESIRNACDEYGSVAHAVQHGSLRRVTQYRTGGDVED